MVAEIDIWRSANLLIQHCGSSAVEHATSRVRDLRAVGDETGVLVWLAIRDAVQSLQANSPPEAHPLH